MIKSLFAAFFATAALTSPTWAEEYQEVHKCDEFAAHPADPNRWAAGVLEVDIIPGPSVKFCRQAVKKHPDTARFQFQLGRALWANNRVEEGLEVFLTLEENFEYGPAYAYLADAYMYGLGGLEPDQELAVALYQIAEEEGFAPASDVLLALSGEDSYSEEIPEQQEVAQVHQEQPNRNRAFSSEIFFEKKVMQALFDGDLKTLRMGNVAYMNVDKSFMYLSGFLQPFQENLNFRDESCIFLADPNLVRAINYKIARGTPSGGLLLGNGRSLEDNLNAGAQQGFQMLGDMLQGINSGQGAYGGKAGDLARATLLKENGEKDATRLIAQYGCQSDATKRIMANVSVYVSGQGKALLSEDEKERREQEARKVTERKERERLAAEERAEASRQAALRTRARASCMKQFSDDKFCSCTLSAMENYSLSDGDWNELNTSFRNVVKISKAHDGLGEAVRTCRKKD